MQGQWEDKQKDSDIEDEVAVDASLERKGKMSVAMLR